MKGHFILQTGIHNDTLHSYIFKLCTAEPCASNTTLCYKQVHGSKWEEGRSRIFKKKMEAKKRDNLGVGKVKLMDL